MALNRNLSYGTDTMSRGAGNVQALTLPSYGDDSEEVFESYNDTRDERAGPDAHPATGGSPLTFLFILIGLVVIMWFVHRASPALDNNSLGVNWFSFVEVGVMASAFILLAKAVFGRWHVRGITNAVAAI